MDEEASNKKVGAILFRNAFYHLMDNHDGEELLLGDAKPFSELDEEFFDEEKGESLYEKGEDTYKVLSLLSRAQLETENGGLPEIAFAAVGVRVRLMLLADDVEAARDILAAFTAAVQEQNANQLLPNIQALQCRLALYSGDAAGVANWLNKAPNEDKEFCVLERYRYLTKVRCYIARGEHLRALALLEKLHYYAEICKRRHRRH